MLGNQRITLEKIEELSETIRESINEILNLLPEMKHTSLYDKAEVWGNSFSEAMVELDESVEDCHYELDKLEEEQDENDGSEDYESEDD